jgi:hypothetical protein
MGQLLASWTPGNRQLDIADPMIEMTSLLHASGQNQQSQLTINVQHPALMSSQNLVRQHSVCVVQLDREKLRSCLVVMTRCCCCCCRRLVLTHTTRRCACVARRLWKVQTGPCLGAHQPGASLAALLSSVYPIVKLMLLGHYCAC